MMADMDTAARLRTELELQLARWSSAGLLSTAQADRIRDWESERQAATAPAAESISPPAAPVRRPLVVEGLAYLGGVVILTALVLAVAGYWHALSATTRIGLAAGGTLALLLAGSLLPQRLGTFAPRLRGVLWLLSTAGLTGLLALVVDGADLAAQRSVLVVSAGTLIYAVTLWLVHGSTAQHLAAFVAAEFFAVGIAVQVSHQTGQVVGAAMAVAGALWAVLAQLRLLPGITPVRSDSAAASGPGDPDPWHRRLGRVQAAAGASVGAVVLAGQQEQPWLGALVIALVLALAMTVGDLAVLSVGSVGTLIVLPLLVTHYFSSTIAVAAVLLGAGGLLVVLAVLVARRRHRKGRPAAG